MVKSIWEDFALTLTPVLEIKFMSIVTNKDYLGIG